MDGEGQMDAESALRAVEPMIGILSRRYAKPGTAATAEELAQEIRLEIIRRFPDYRPDRAKWSTFAFNLAKSACRHYLRDLAHVLRTPGWAQEQGVMPPCLISLDRRAHGNKADSTADANTLADQFPAPDGPDSDLLADLHHAIAKLKPLQQSCLRLHYWEGFTKSEIARMLGISPNYVCYLITTAEIRLQRLLGEPYLREGIYT